MVISIVFACLLAATQAVPAPSNKHAGDRGGDHGGDRSWDYFVFAQSWPYAMCHVANLHQPGSCVIPDNVNDWTIHGLWPSRITGHQGPTNCKPDQPFDMSKVQNILKELEVQWPNLIAGDTLTSFWKHEWSKHGTCSEDLPTTKDETSYFSVALKLNSEYSVSKLLKKAGIEPSATTTFTLEQFLSGLEHSSRKTLQVHCLETEEDGQKKWYVQDVRICLDKTLNEIDCPGVESILEQPEHPISDDNIELKGGRPPHHTGLPNPITCKSNTPLHYLPPSK